MINKAAATYTTAMSGTTFSVTLSMSRYLTPSVHSTNFDDMPKRPAMIIQKVAPGPPIEIATATIEMLPRPTVPETAVAKAWK